MSKTQIAWVCEQASSTTHRPLFWCGDNAVSFEISNEQVLKFETEAEAREAAKDCPFAVRIKERGWDS